MTSSTPQELDTAGRGAGCCACRSGGSRTVPRPTCCRPRWHWAAMHSVDSIEDAATICESRYGDTGMPVAGEGAPLVAEFAITEFAAAIGVSTDAGKPVRRPRPRAAPTGSRGCGAGWSRVTSGRGWPGGSPTRPSSSHPEAAAFVDRHVAHVAHKIGPVQLERLVDEAIATFMPDLAEERRLAKADGRYFTVEQQQISYAGTSDGARRARPGRRPRPRAGRRRAGRPAQGPGLGGLAERPPRGRGRRAGPPPARPRPDDSGWLRRALRARLETTTAEAAGGPLRPPLPGRPRRHRAPRGWSRATSWSPPARSATGAAPPARSS